MLSPDFIFAFASPRPLGCGDRGWLHQRSFSAAERPVAKAFGVSQMRATVLSGDLKPGIMFLFVLGSSILRANGLGSTSVTAGSLEGEPGRDLFLKRVRFCGD